MRVLAISTSTEYCSAALKLGPEVLEREWPADRLGGEHVLELVHVLLAEAQAPLVSLDAIAFGRGPGGFTGVRLAASVTQGLAFAAALPVIPVSDLQALAQQVFMLASDLERCLICQDARMQQVYWAWFENVAGFSNPSSAERVDTPEAVFDGRAQLALADCGGAGSGFAAYPRLLERFGAQGVRLWPALRARASAIAVLAAHFGVASACAPAEALPVYVRDQVAVTPDAVR